MSYGLYAAAAGMDVQQARLDTVANNLANAATPGFLSDRVVVTGFPQFLAMYRVDGDEASLGSAAFGPLVQGTSIDFAPGPLKKTGNSTDMALAGGAFFKVRGGAGQTYYTRGGAFTIDSGGYLATATGERVLGTTGPIRVEGRYFTVDAQGRLTAGTRKYTLALTSFTNPAALVKSGDNLYTAPASAGARRVTLPRVLQGYLMGSNTDLIKQMVDLVDAERAFQSDQKMTQAEDELMKQSAQLGNPS